MVRKAHVNLGEVGVDMRKTGERGTIGVNMGKAGVNMGEGRKTTERQVWTLGRQV